MKVVIAPDSYKGCLSALEVAKAMERGVLSVFPSAEVRKIPIADGGEGTVAALVTATNGQLRQAEVTDPLGNKISAHWGVLGDGRTAVIEMAAASGLPLVPKEKRDPRVTTTYGTGELIKAALAEGLAKIIIGIGGSATMMAEQGWPGRWAFVFLMQQDRKLQQAVVRWPRYAKLMRPVWIRA